MRRIRILLAAVAVSIGAAVGLVSAPISDAHPGAYCNIYTGIVMSTGPRAVQLWHGPFCSITVVSASRAWTCDPGEYYNGYTCPEHDSGGGDSW